MMKTIKDGNWWDAACWDTGKVPGEFDNFEVLHNMTSPKSIIVRGIGSCAIGGITFELEDPIGIGNVMAGLQVLGAGQFLFGTPSTNTIPTVNAGSDAVIQLPTNIVRLTAVGSETPMTYRWTKVSGPTAGVIGSPSSASTLVSSLQAGTYIYRVTATAPDGDVTTDDVSVTVQAASSLQEWNQVMKSGAIVTLQVQSDGWVKRKP